MSKNSKLSLVSLLGLVVDNVALAGFIGVILLVFLQVLLRYIFKVSVFWTEELARLLFTWITLLGAAVALREDEHIYINIFIKRIPNICVDYSIFV